MWMHTENAATSVGARLKPPNDLEVYLQHSHLVDSQKSRAHTNILSRANIHSNRTAKLRLSSRLSRENVLPVTMQEKEGLIILPPSDVAFHSRLAHPPSLAGTFGVRCEI
jgi:hypothetical protein